MSDAVAPSARRRLPVDVDIEPVPAGARGARVIGGLMAVATLVGLGFLALGAWLPSTLHAAVGLADTVTAEVTDRVFRPQEPGFGKYDRGSCAAYRYTVAWDDREGTFDACLNGDLGDLEVGDRVEVRATPWSGEVVPPGGFDWALTGMAVGGLVTWWAARGTRRYLRLAGGRAHGPRYTGTVDHVASNTVTLRLDHPDGARLRLLPTMRTTPYVAGQRAVVWASGVRRWRRRPHGPWAVRLGGEGGPVHAATHAWVRR